ncbi:probable cytochrome P450 49a1 [Penaeus indicus]|uniref:probable cytochrome P450 49a1 n=1 Tax=Penaeus indicus TaxID=29960 RepID=UPI00300C36C6
MNPNTRRFLASSFASVPPSSARHHALRSQDSKWGTTWAWTLGFVGRRPCSSSSSGLHQEFGDSDRVRPYESIPGPKALPLVGNKLLFTPLGGYSLERYWESCWKLYTLYGPIVRLAKLTGQFDMVLVFRPEDTRRIFEKEGRLPVRPALDILEYYRMRNPDMYSSPGLVPGNGEEWKRLRVCVHSLLRRELVQSYRAAQAGVARDLATAVDDAQRRHPEGPVPDLLYLLFRYTLEAVGVVSLGTRLGCLDAAHATSHAQTRARDVIAANEESLAVMGASFFSPPLYRVLPTRAYNALSRAQRTIGSVVEEQLRRRRKEHAQDPSGFKEQHPFLSSLLERQDIAPTDVFLLVLEVFQGGIDATATTLGFCLHYLSREKEKQEVLYNEVKDVEPATHTLQGLPYLRAVVQEAMRLRPSAGGRTRVIDEAGVFCGFHVPAGTCVSSPPVVACFDPEVFPEPHQFRPERWLSRTRSTQAASSQPTPTGGGGGGGGSTTPTPTPGEEKRIHPYTIVPFGHGARMCPGRRVAEQEIYLALIQVVKAFRMECVRSPGGADEPVGQVLRLNMMPDAPIAIRFTRR